jgi:hypothetical protein
MTPTVIWRRDASRLYQIGAHTVRPVSQNIGIRWRRGGWLWQFPLAVEVQDAEVNDDEEDAQRRLPIPDPTRILVWFLYGLALAVIIAAVAARWRQRRASKERIKG